MRKAVYVDKFTLVLLRGCPQPATNTNKYLTTEMHAIELRHYLGQMQYICQILYYMKANYMWAINVFVYVIYGILNFRC